MVADSIHVLVGIALVALVRRTDDATPYLVAALVSAIPDIDMFLFAYVIRGPSAPLFAHRGITHSLFAAVVVVALAALVGQWRVAALAYGSHLASDLVTGQVMLFAPFTTSMYGVEFGWYVINAIVGGLAIAVVLGTILTFSFPEAVSRVRGRASFPSF